MDLDVQHWDHTAQLAFAIIAALGFVGVYAYGVYLKNRPDSKEAIASDSAIRADFAAAIAASNKSLDGRFDQSQHLQAAAINGVVCEADKLELRVRKTEQEIIRIESTFRERIETLFRLYDGHKRRAP